MAATVSHLVNTVHGNQRCRQLNVTFDGATATVETGLSKIDAVAMTPVSISGGTTMSVYPNSNASGVQSHGVLGCSGFVAGDIALFIVYGR